jgi:organic hydroperoxide reductase OsmC/OhrA
VTAYHDAAVCEMTEDGPGGAGQFRLVVLRPHVVLAAGGDIQRAHALHAVAHDSCFIARSVNFPVRHEAVVTAE